MKISTISPCSNHVLKVVSDDGKTGYFDISPYLESEAFAELKDKKEFERFHNGGYFIEWECGADLSSDTIEAHWSDKLHTNAQQKHPI